MALAACLTPLAGCGDDGPAVEIEGGGFVFNYRIAEAFYGVSVRPLRRLPDGTVIEARFEDPAGGAPIVVREAVRGGRLAYMLRTPALAGIVKGRDYRVEVHVLAHDGHELGQVTRTFRSTLDQAVLPDKPLTIGPGYTRNPDAGTRP